MTFILCLVAAAVLVVALVHISMLTRQLPQRQTRDSHRLPDQQDAVQHEHKAVSADAAALIDAITKEGDASRAEEKREDDDQKLREWITIGLIGATLGALGLQVNEMVKVYGPIAKQAEVASDSETKQLRAYVFTTIITPLNDFFPNVEHRYAVMFANGGATPAYDLASGLHARFISIPSPQSIEEYGGPAVTPKNAILGDYLFKEHTQKFNSMPVTLTPAESNAVRDGKAGIFFWGEIIYRDIFRCQHHTNFCVGLWAQRAGVDAPAEYQCPIHNDVDDPNKCDKD